jgi:hypothetical protein
MCRDFWLIFRSRGQKTIDRENILPPVGAILPRILFADLEATSRTFPQEVRDDPARETFTLAVSIVRHFFGHQWYLDHVFQDAARSRPDGFMRIDYTPGAVGKSKTSRLLDFAENLFNLQHIDGFDYRVNQMRAAPPRPAAKVMMARIESDFRLERAMAPHPPPDRPTTTTPFGWTSF